MTVAVPSAHLWQDTMIVLVARMVEILVLRRDDEEPNGSVGVTRQAVLVV